MLMHDETVLFDSEEEYDEKKEPSEDKKLLFHKELGQMLYGFGDAKVPHNETIERLEKITLEYIKQVCLKALTTGKPNKINLEDIHYLIRRDNLKFGRVKELLSMHEEIKKARKAFEDIKEIF